MKLNSARRSAIANKLMIQREELEMRIHYKMEAEKERRFRKIREDYYRRNPGALRYIPIDEEEYRLAIEELKKEPWHRSGKERRKQNDQEYNRL
jgi:hypothetical protein